MSHPDAQHPAPNQSHLHIQPSGNPTPTPPPQRTDGPSACSRSRRRLTRPTSTLLIKRNRRTTTTNLGTIPSTSHKTRAHHPRLGRAIRRQRIIAVALASEFQSGISVSLGRAEIDTRFNRHRIVAFPIGVQRAVTGYVGAAAEIGPAFGGAEVGYADWEGAGCGGKVVGRGFEGGGV
jgi:hypothetical protein